MTAVFVFALSVLAVGWLALRPLREGGRAWPVDPPDRHDDVARAVSSLRDLEFARAAGTIDADDHERLRAALEREAFVRRPAVPRAAAPVRTLAVAALLAGIAVALIVAALPREVGDRAPGTTITGTVPLAGPSIAELERQTAERPNDVPTLLALADAYRIDGSAADAARVYQRVLSIDSGNVSALNALAVILFESGELQAALATSERVLALRPSDPDALFLKGLVHHQRGDYQLALEAWTSFLDVGEFHPAAGMVRALSADAREKLAGR